MKRSEWKGMHARNTSGWGWLAICLGGCLALVAPALQAEVRLPNGEYRASSTDLRVKVLGGEVAVERTWQAVNLNKGQYRWYLNPAWADLELEYDATTGELRSIGRAGAKFEAQGTDVFVLVESERTYFIRALRGAQGAVAGLRWSDRLGNTIDYDAAGRIRSYAERNGVSVRFARDGNGRIETVRDHADRTVLTFDYNTAGQVGSITDASGRRVRYHYTGTALTGVTDVLGYAWSYAYASGLLTRQTDPEQRATTIAYQGNRVVKVTDPQGYATTYTYDYNRGTRQYEIKETSPEGRQTYSRYDASGKRLQQEAGTRLTYRVIKDAANVDIEVDERGLRTRTEYDANRNPVKVTWPDGATTTTTWDGRYSLPLERTDELGVVTKYAYDAKGNLVTLIEAAGLPEQRVTTATYDAYGQRLTQTVKGATPADDATTTWTYDGAGNVQSITDAENHTTAFEYDAQGNVVKRTDARGEAWLTPTNAAGWLTSQRDPLGNETTFLYDKTGHRIATVDAEGHASTMSYTSNGWPETAIDALSGSTTTRYTKDGQRKEQIDANGVRTVYGYDADGRLTTITDGAGNVTTLVYGRTCANQPALGLEGLLTATKYPTYCEEYKYDGRGRRMQAVRVLSAAGASPEERQASTTGYDAKGQTISETDPLGRSTQRAYDALGRLASVTDPAGGVTAYGYDVRDNLTSVTDANGHTHRFTYDKVNQLKTEARPLGEPIRYVYDAIGNLITRTSPNGERRDYTYDAAGRRLAESHTSKDASTPSQTVSYTYDRRNLLTGYVQSGDTHSSATYVYDAKGQKLDETVTYGSGAEAFTKTLHYAYEPNGLKKSLTYPDGTVQTSTYDRNRLATITIQEHTIRYQDYRWQMPTKVTMPGAIRTLSYDALQRPTRIRSESVAGAVIMDYRYTYDAAGNIMRRETENGVYDYTYDALDRLTGATPPESLQRGPGNPSGLPVEQYTYDPVHNRATSAHQPGPWVYTANNELTGYGHGADEQTYRYDANGNTIEQRSGDPLNPSKTRTFLYNAGERLNEIRDNGSSIGRYQYDPMGRRIRKETLQGVTWFQYADEGLVAEYSGVGVLNVTYGWEVGGEGGRPVWRADHGGIDLYHNDLLGSSQRLTSGTGGIDWSLWSTGYGRILEKGGDKVNNITMPGHYYDREVSLNQNYKRYYSSDIGRYIEKDSFGVDGGINIYEYAQSNPLLYIDFYGERAVNGINAPPSHTWRNGAGSQYNGGRAANGGQERRPDWGNGGRNHAPWDNWGDFFRSPKCFSMALRLTNEERHKFDTYRLKIPRACIANCMICFSFVETNSGICPLAAEMLCPAKHIMSDPKSKKACFKFSDFGLGESYCPRFCPENYD